ncbi:MAG: hypothetical protein KGK33_13785 [Hyphomicrobiales bacterium]|nr:hypothetical protein [Hyphomicrobiales bacterium]MDE2285677.1 hypothetical protein [Hyphomicrobiales bacterium]
MQKRPFSARLLLKNLLWHCLMSVTLGVLCGGLFLQIGAMQSGALFHGADTFVARFRFLLMLGFFFGVGGTITGAMFLAAEKEQSQSR